MDNLFERWLYGLVIGLRLDRLIGWWLTGLKLDGLTSWWVTGLMVGWIGKCVETEWIDWLVDNRFDE